MLAFGCGHHNPSAAAAFVKPTGVVSDTGIHFDLHAFDVRTMFRVDSSYPRMEKHTAVTGRLAFELQAQLEIAIGFFRGQVAVLVGRAFAQDCFLFNDPLLLPVLFPPGQICSIEKRNPAVFWWRLSNGAEPEEYQRSKNDHDPVHDKPSVSDCTGITSSYSKEKTITNAGGNKSVSAAGRSLFSEAP